MRQRGVETLMTEEPDDLIGHVRICGGAGWVTTGSTRNRIAATLRFGTSRTVASRRRAVSFGR
jgi:hypothetical protein